MNTKQAQQELAKKPVEELFLIMAMKDESQEEALSAFGEFYKRYHPFLDSICKKVCVISKLNNAEVSEVIYSNTLVKIYEKAISFVTIEKEKNVSNKEKLLKGWIGKIAENELLQILRRGEHDCKKFVHVPDEELPELTFDDSPPNDIPLPEENRLLEAAMLELSTTERDILIEISLYKAKGKYTPRDIIEKLSQQYHVTHDSIRQTYHRATKKIKQKLIIKTQNYELHGRPTNYERRNL